MTLALAASTSGTISPPSIEYSQLAPMLVVFGAAVAGILVEAFTPRPLRRPVQLTITLVSLLAAFVLTIVIASFSIFKKGSPGHIAAMGAVVPEALAAAQRLAELGTPADVVCLTSPGLLFRALRARQGHDATGETWILDQAFPAARAVPLVTG